MTPLFRIFADSSEITKEINKRLLSLRITDESGQQSDTLEITVDDRDNKIELPKKGKKLKVLLGYKEQGLVDMGVFVVDELELSGPPDTLTIKAKVADMLAGLKVKRSFSWTDITLSNLVKTIAARHKLTARLAASLEGMHISHLDQTDESDLHLLTRLAKDYGAIAKPVAGYLLFVPKGMAKSVSGKKLPSIKIRKNQISDYRLSMADRGRYQSVKVYYFEKEIGVMRQTLTVGSGEPLFVMRQNFPDRKTAKLSARAKLNALSRSLGVLNLTLKMGDSLLAAESRLHLSGFRPGVDGEWVATRVEHNLSSSGYSSTLDAEIFSK